MQRKSMIYWLPVLFALTLYACNNKQPEQKKTVQVVKPKERKSPAVTGYTFASGKEWWKQNQSDDRKTNIVLAINRTDSVHFKKMDTVIIPQDFSGDVEAYLPFPYHVDALNDVNKIIFFSYPAQAFAAYEHGELLYTGPTNMGRKKDPTPAGLYFTNWKAEKTTSTFNDEWELKWNFNIQNKEGIGFHEYELPGYPASHSCLRLQEKDAKLLYNWADQWVLQGQDNLLAKGTPVIVFGTYNFDGPKPWWQLVTDPGVLRISETEVEHILSPYRDSIMSAQTRRALVNR